VFEKFHELVDRQSSIGYDSPKRTGSQMLVIRHHDTGVRVVATKNHVTSRLAPEHEACALQRRPDLAP
jgi:hypothetical protein